MAFSFEATDYQIGYQYNHLHIHSIESGEIKKGNVHGIDLGYLYQKAQDSFAYLHFSVAKGSVFGGDFNRGNEKLHYIQIENQDVFGFNFVANAFACIPYLGFGFFLKSEIPFYPMDYCSIVYSFFVPLGLRFGYDFTNYFTLIFDIQTQVKFYGRWFIIGHPMLTGQSSSLKYKDIACLVLYGNWKISKKDGLSLAAFYKHLNIKQKHSTVFFDGQNMIQCGFTLLYYFHF